MRLTPGTLVRRRHGVGVAMVWSLPGTLWEGCRGVASLGRLTTALVVCTSSPTQQVMIVADGTVGWVVPQDLEAA